MTDDVINPENSSSFNYLRRYSLNRWTIGVSTSCAGTQIQLSRVLEERFKARDLRCPHTALHCASSLSKWQSGVPKERFISMSARLSPGCSRCPSSLSKWQSGVPKERFISMSARLSPGCSRCPSSLSKWQSGVLEEHWTDTRKWEKYRCPRTLRPCAVPLVCQNDKVDSSRSAEKIRGSGKSTAVLEPAIISLSWFLLWLLSLLIFSWVLRI